MHGLCTELGYVRSKYADTLDLNDLSKHVPNSKVYIKAAAAMQEIKSDIVIANSFDDCKKLEPLSILAPEVAFNLRIPSLENLFDLMPYIKEIAHIQ